MAADARLDGFHNNRGRSRKYVAERRFDSDFLRVLTPAKLRTHYAHVNEQPESTGMFESGLWYQIRNPSRKVGVFYLALEVGEHGTPVRQSGRKAALGAEGGQSPSARDGASQSGLWYQ